MPAILTVTVSTNTNPNGWRRGEAVNNLEDHTFGWYEMPKVWNGQHTVAEVNAFDVDTTDPYIVVEMLDAGRIILGKVDVEVGDVIVLQFDEREKFWTGFGQRPQSEYDEKRRYIWRVSDKTPEEMEQFMAPHVKVIQMTVTNGPDPQGFRRIRIENLWVTASGDNSWEQDNVDEFILQWNNKYPECGLVQVGQTTAAVIVVEGTFTQGQAEEFEETVIEFGLNDTYANRRWYINQQGMNILASNDGFISSTAEQLGQVFRDGLDD